jgi:DHA1 family bicyclomycin/chloramphenicol resistance-like MFS transporter
VLAPVLSANPVRLALGALLATLLGFAGWHVYRSLTRRERAAA